MKCQIGFFFHSCHLVYNCEHRIQEIYNLHISSLKISRSSCLSEKLFPPTKLSFEWQFNSCYFWCSQDILSLTRKAILICNWNDCAHVLITMSYVIVLLTASSEQVLWKQTLCFCLYWKWPIMETYTITSCCRACFTFSGFAC
jgi:hypothetical protein